MSESNSLMQLRVDEHLKTQFFQLAQRNGESPSNFLRGLMRRAVEKDSGRVEDVAHELIQVREILRETLSYLQRSALVRSDEQAWQLYKETFLPEYLHELIGDSLRDSGLTGDEYSQQFKEGIRRNWFVDTAKFRLPLTSYLHREFMDEIRREVSNEDPSKAQDERNSAVED